LVRSHAGHQNVDIKIFRISVQIDRGLATEASAGVKSRPEKTSPAETPEGLIDLVPKIFHIPVNVPSSHIVLLVIIAG
jgi:hypothetical protein